MLAKYSISSFIICCVQEEHGRTISTLYLIILCLPQKLTKPLLSPKKPLVSDSPSPSKPKSQSLDLFQKPPLAPRYLSPVVWLCSSQPDSNVCAGMVWASLPLYLSL